MRSVAMVATLAAALAVAAPVCAQEAAPGRGPCVDDREVLIDTEPKVDENLKAAKQVMLKRGLLAPGDSAELVVGGAAPVLQNRMKILHLILKYSPRSNPSGSRTTRVMALVDTGGHVADARVSTSSGNSGLDGRAVKVVRAMVFSPATHDGCRVRAQVTLPITFNTFRTHR